MEASRIKANLVAAVVNISDQLIFVKIIVIFYFQSVIYFDNAFKEISGRI